LADLSRSVLKKSRLEKEQVFFEKIKQVSFCPYSYVVNKVTSKLFAHREQAFMQNNISKYSFTVTILAK